MFELIHVLAGVRRQSGHPDSIEVRPHFAGYGLKRLEGELITEYGPVRFDYTCADGIVSGSQVLPEGMRGTLVLTGREPQELVPGENRF
jgi:hypothetical protein